jgi:hypothetical protein
MAFVIVLAALTSPDPQCSHSSANVTSFSFSPDFTVVDHHIRARMPEKLTSHILVDGIQCMHANAGEEKITVFWSHLTFGHLNSF